MEVWGLWDYRSWQPRLPVTGTGVVALGQPLILLPLTFWLLARWDRQINAPARH